MSEDAVHVFVGQRDCLAIRLRPPLNARHPSVQAATSHAREIAARDHVTLLIHDASGAIASRESFRDE